jgi:hypothetical protein
VSVVVQRGLGRSIPAIGFFNHWAGFMPALEGSLTFALYLYRGLERRRVSRAFGNYFISVGKSAGQPGFLVNIILLIVGGGGGVVLNMRGVGMGAGMQNRGQRLPLAPCI